MLSEAKDCGSPGARPNYEARSPLEFDRFRFDSFAPDSTEQRQLLSRLGRPRLIYYLFMITAPDKTVERAWKRGLDVGRFKPLDDLLGHNVEAYTGMESFFLSRALAPGTLIQHYEFVDNDVPFGQLPLTVAFGCNGKMNIMDVRRMLDFDRYRKINANACRREDVYNDPDFNSPRMNVSFLRKCVRNFPSLTIAQRSTGRIYACFECGHFVWSDAAQLHAIDDPVATEGLHEVCRNCSVRLRATTHHAIWTQLPSSRSDVGPAAQNPLDAVRQAA